MERTERLPYRACRRHTDTQFFNQLFIGTDTPPVVQRAWGSGDQVIHAFHLSLAVSRHASKPSGKSIGAHRALWKGLRVRADQHRPVDDRQVEDRHPGPRKSHSRGTRGRDGEGRPRGNSRRARSRSSLYCQGPFALVSHTGILGKGGHGTEQLLDPRATIVPRIFPAEW